MPMSLAQLEKRRIGGQGTEVHGQPLALTPTQHWLFERDLIDPQNYNNAYLYRIPNDTDAEVVGDALSKLALRYDALRLFFVQSPEGWQQYLTGDDRLVRFDVCALKEAEPACAMHEMMEVARHFRTRLNLAAGPTFQAVLFRRRDSESNWLLLIASHLNHDFWSWNILIGELDRLLYNSAAEEETPDRRTRTAFADHVHDLLCYAQSGAESEIEYWKSVRWKEAHPLPTDFSIASWSNTYQSSDVASVRLDAAVCQRLERWNPRLLGAQVGHAVLAAVCWSVSQWAKSEYCHTELTRHGRTALPAGMAPTRTIGYLTVNCPFVCRVPANASPRAAATMVAQEINSIPTGGIGYGVLRYLHPDPAVRELLSRAPVPPIKFNFVENGLHGSEGDRKPVLERERVVMAPTLHPDNLRHYLLNVEARGGHHGITLDVRYSRRIHTVTTIDRFISSIQKFLELLVVPA